MKIKDFLELCKDECCYVSIFDEHTYETTEYKHIQEAIREYGYFPLNSWYMELGGLKIETRTQF